MGEKAMRSGGGRGPRASRAELDALCAVVAATADVAEQTRSEAAAVLLRRALVLLRGRCSVPDGTGGDFRAC